MRILADENLDRPLVSWLREQGHDVTWVAEENSGDPDEAVLSEAVSGRRIVVTFDLDFGSMIFRDGEGAAGVVLLRLRTRSPSELLRLFTSHWPEIERNAPGHFVVATNSRLRIRPLPE